MDKFTSTLATLAIVSNALATAVIFHSFITPQPVNNNVQRLLLAPPSNELAVEMAVRNDRTPLSLIH